MALMLTSLVPTSVALQEVPRAAMAIRAPVVGKGKGVVTVLDSQNLFTDDVFVFVDVAGVGGGGEGCSMSGRCGG